MEIKYKHLISIIIVSWLGASIIALGLSSLYIGQSNNYVLDSLFSVYERLYKVEKTNPLIKPNTSITVKLLKEALDYIESNNTVALNLIKEANKSLNTIIGEYNLTVTLFYIKIIALIIVVVTIIIVYKLFLRKKLFRYWFKLRANNIVVRGNGRPKSILFSREAVAVILAVLTVGAIIVTVETLRPLVSEHYMQLGIIGKKGILGNYDIVHPIGDNVTFKVFVGNMLGYTVLCDVRIFLVINNTTKKLLYNKYLLLGDKENTTIPFTIRVNYTGLQNIVVELWKYDPITSSFAYTGRKVNIWIKGIKV